MTREMTIEEIVAEHAQPIITKQVHEMTFAVMGSDYSPVIEKRLYDKLGCEHFEANAAASDFVVAWCKTNGEWGNKWGSVRIARIDHYAHGKSGGHYCITALLEETAREE